MAGFDFDEEQRRSYQEPQTTKTELLRDPSHSTLALGTTIGSARQHASGLTDLLSRGAPWSFNDMEPVTPSTKLAATHIKRESDSPSEDRGRKRRQHNESFTYDMASTAIDETTYSALRSTEDAGDRHNRSIGVIDLTSDAEDSESEKGFPQRQFVPRAGDEASASRLAKPKAPDQPRTFTRGLSPIAPHPKKPPIVHRSKPPVKPLTQRQSSSYSPAPASHPVFNPRLKSIEARLSTSRSMTPSRGSTPHPSQVPGSLGSFSTRLSTPSTRPRKTGPFLQDDSNDEDESPATTRADSVSRLGNRRKDDTPDTPDLVSMQEQSRKMREAAAQRKAGYADSLDTIENESADGYGSSLTLHDSGSSFLGVPHQRMMQ